jgi:hypothetical protein
MEHAQDAFAAARADDASSRAVLSLRLVTPGVLGFANRDAALQHLLFATCALGVLTGAVPVEPPVALELGALTLHMRPGPPPAVGSLRDPSALRTILPSAVVARFAKEQLEDELLARYSALPPLSATDAQAAYCTIVEDSDYFGVSAPSTSTSASRRRASSSLTTTAPPSGRARSRGACCSGCR